MATLYSKLGVSEDASEADIKRAYRKAAMKWHPDRNAGQEETARVIFQEIKDAYEILSDANKRDVYDAVYAKEMQRWGKQRQQRDEEKAQREHAAQAAAQAQYAERVSLAMRYIEHGHNRDVAFGVLLGRGCEPQLARHIADSVWALHQSRMVAEHVRSAARGKKRKTATPREAGGDPDKREKKPTGLFDSLWQSFFGVRS
ncbi:MAG TPA: DnaJ domain-containing protein [Paraburkholderia sp.]|jgi:curved DNA-binding protein CbpA